MLNSERIVAFSHRMVPGEEEFPLEVETFNTDESILKACSVIFSFSYKIEKLIWMDNCYLGMSGGCITREVVIAEFDQDCILGLTL